MLADAVIGAITTATLNLLAIGATTTVTLKWLIVGAMTMRAAMIKVVIVGTTTGAEEMEAGVGMMIKRMKAMAM